MARRRRPNKPKKLEYRPKRVIFGRMVAALKQPPRPMTVTEFLDWHPDDGSDKLWQLRDGEPEAMAPATERHGTIQLRLSYLLTGHLDRTRPSCRAVGAPGVVPRIGSDMNMLVPDIGITCDPSTNGLALTNPLVLIEILSPSNTVKTRANVWAYTTIPSVTEILLVHTVRIGAELLRRQPDGNWPQRPQLLGPDDELRLDSIGFAAPLRAAYVNSGLE
jgi:Uma2 family endonuclease